MNQITYQHVYIHVPFCSRRCSYCDFSIAVRKDVPAAEFVSGIRQELAVRRSGGSALGSAQTIYLGGGTPSKLGPACIATLYSVLKESGITPAPDAELTVEANPEDLTGEAAEGLLLAGANRLSVGVQSFDPAVLEWMHRTHSADQSADAVRAARSAGFRDISVDLIYALPERLNRDWDRDIDLALALEPDHISVYGLTVEPHTPLGRWTARGAEVPETDDHAADQFLRAHDRLTAAGFEHYEVSSYGRPGKRSRHNSAYWKRVPYLGLGPSAHSYDGTTRRWNVAAYAEWQRALAAGDPVAGTEILDQEQIDEEVIYLGLRTSEGLAVRAEWSEKVLRWVEAGWAELDSNRVRLLPEGWLRMDALVADLDSPHAPGRS
jgi:oxygen-independent coproporphyrinogen-3 oxidase